MSNDSPSELTSPKSSNSYVLIFGCFMLVGLVFLAWLGRPPRSTAIGEKLPRLDLTPLVFADQKIANLDLNGKLAVLHFWGTWCPPCMKEFPEFIELTEAFGDSADVVIVSVSCSGGPEYDLENLRQQTQQYMNSLGAEIPTYADSAAMTRQGLALLLPNGSLGYPTTILIDRDGTIIEALEGYLPGEMKRLAAKIQSKL